MTYKWTGENWGRSMIRDAIKAGFTIEVSYERGYGEPDYKGRSPAKAWEAVTAVDECHVFLRKKGARTEWAYIVLEYGQNGDEVISDHSLPPYGDGTTKGWIEQWWIDKSAAQRAKEARS